MPARVSIWIVRVFVCVGAIAVTGSDARSQTVLAPWSNADVGSPAIAGSAAESAGTFTVRGGGADIWYSADQFHFVYQAVTGDVDVRARVAGLEYVHAWTKAGVMIRETLAGNARHAMTIVSPAKGLAFQRRVTAGGASAHTSGGMSTAPFWVRLVRAGQLFSSYVSPDGAAWTLVGTETIPMNATVYAGLAVTSHDATRSAMATVSDVSITMPSPPPPSAWTNRDIGSPALAGRASQSGGTFSVTGAGADIWDDSDQFHFMYQSVEGDLEIVARVGNLGYVHAWSKAGVMIRESLSASAAQAFMAGTPGKGWAFQRRPLSGGISVHSPGSFSAPPGWVRLVRTGDTFSAYESVDGSNWSIVGTETIPMAPSVYVGLAVTSHYTSKTITATFTNVTISNLASSNQPPTVTLTAPASGTTYPAPATIVLAATASDSDGTVAKVDFFADGQRIGSDSDSPYQATWNNVPEGTYRLTAVATDSAGATTTSATATVTVNAVANQPPTAAITSPSNGASFGAPATIAIAASASDGDGTVTRVDSYSGTQLIGSDSSSPFAATWNNVAAGTYALTVVAFDNDGASTSSAAIGITVNAAPPPPPSPTSVAFSPSLDHAGVTSYAVAIYRADSPTTPVATKDLGKPTPSNGDITSDISDIVNPLPTGSYFAIVSAIGPGGSSPSAPSAPFAR